MMIKQGIPSIMVTHLQVPAFDDRPNRPTVVSKKATQDLLRAELKFKGLIITDAMDMKGVTKHFDPGVADVEAFLAGNDIILIPEDIDKGVLQIKKAVADSTISMQRLEESVRRILSAKFDLGLHADRVNTSSENLLEEINHPRSQVIKSKIYERALTLVSNDQKTLPIKELSGIKFGSISLGATNNTQFQHRMSSYVKADHFNIPQKSEQVIYDEKLVLLEYHDVVLVSLHSMSRYSSKNYGLDPKQIDFIHELAGKTKVILTLFGSPYALKYFELIHTIVVAYEEDNLAQDAAAQAIFGAIDITGKLPVSASEKFRVGKGINIPSLRRIGFAIPEAVGLNSDTLRHIEEIVDEMIAEKAAPGCQVLIAKDNKVVYHRAFGHHTYDNKTKVGLNDIYDVASVTKVMASTISAMHLQDQGSFNLNDPVAKYIPEEDTTNKASLIYEDILAHVSGLAGWIPFYAKTLDSEKKNTLSANYYRRSPEAGFNIMVTPNLYLRFGLSGYNLAQNIFFFIAGQQ